MSWRVRKEGHVPQGIDEVSPSYKHPHLVMVPDSHVLPLDLVTQFVLVYMQGRLFSGKQPTQPRPTDPDERPLFCRPYREWAPAPYNTPTISADSGINRAMIAIAGMDDIFTIVTTTSTECDRDLHHLKTRLLSGLPPMSLTRWRQKRLHEPQNIARACQHLSATIDAFEYLQLPHNQSRMRKACNRVWDASADFQRAFNAYRAEKGRGEILATALWEEFLDDYFATVVSRAHAWVTARVGELREAQLVRLGNTTAVPGGATMLTPVTSTQMKILDRVHDLAEITNNADTKIMLPLVGYTIQTLASKIPDIRSDWNGYDGSRPMTRFPLDMRLRARIHALRSKWLSHRAIFARRDRIEAEGRRLRDTSDPEELVEVVREQVAAYDQTRAELRAGTSAAAPLRDDPWIESIRAAMEMSEVGRFRVWGFVGYRLHYGHSDEEWRAFLEAFKRDVTNWGEGVDGAAWAKPLCKVRWLDGRNLGIAEGDIEAAKRHYASYRLSPECDQLLTSASFLAADKPSIDSYLDPVKEDDQPLIPAGDMGSFILTARAHIDDIEDANDARDGRAPPPRRRPAPAGASDGTLRVLGSILFDDFWPLQHRNSLSVEALARLAEIHPRQVYVGPTVPAERDVWRVAGTWAFTMLNGFEKWRTRS
ncbi:hypothetical protein CMUS01_06947 [Colletotrichum musicola]|uniref:Uncharacterized protein n=1 Tax=Colletotrichum musicola TaxID=2175873 RepID=A0A8H6KKI8_9PEZI|nr:hypothetical protein CMUS01_06947 [Colletotrichum musicola]